MDLYHYSLVRCVPEPRTGEFINIGAIAGAAGSGDWDVRQIANERRAAKICNSVQLGAVHHFLAYVADTINEAELQDEFLPQDWLKRFSQEMRNVVQVSSPQAAAGNSAVEVLDVVFERMLIDPTKSTRAFVGKATLLASLRAAFKSRLAAINVVEKPEVHVGGHLRANLDFALGQRSAVQITQAWSFQKESVDDVATEVKAWGYALQKVREGEQARIISRTGNVMDVAPDVEVDVLLARPQSPRQIEVFEEAQEVFNELGVATYDMAGAEALGEHAKVLVAA